jgi:hypothetical protein
MWKLPKTKGNFGAKIVPKRRFCEKSLLNSLFAGIPNRDLAARRIHMSRQHR